MQSFNWVTDSLLEEQAESSFVREDELAVSADWMNALVEGADPDAEKWVGGWIDAGRLFGFVCGDEDSDDLLALSLIHI